MPFHLLFVMIGAQTARLRAALRSRVEGDAGASTLELVIITLGLIAVATLLVVALTTAVTNRTDQIQ